MEIYNDRGFEFAELTERYLKHTKGLIFFDIVDYLNGKNVETFHIYVPGVLNIESYISKFERDHFMYRSNHFAYDQKCLVVVMEKSRQTFKLYFGSDPRYFKPQNNIFVLNDKLDWICSHEDDAVKIVEQKPTTQLLTCKSFSHDHFYFGFDAKKSAYGPSELVLLYNKKIVKLGFSLEARKSHDIKPNQYLKFLQGQFKFVDLYVGENVGSVFNVYVDGRSKTVINLDPSNLPKNYLRIVVYAIPSTNGTHIAEPIDAKNTIYYEKIVDGSVTKSGFIN